MIKRINPQQLIKTEQFIREPVDTLSKELTESSSKKIILDGGRGSGKSVVLENIQDKGLGTRNQTILIRFDSIISFSLNPNEEFDEKFFKHFYEMSISNKLLSYVRKNYPLTYETNFKDIEFLLSDITNKTYNYINNISYENVKFKSFLTPSELSSKILKRLKKCLNIDSLTLAVDRFDWINGSSAYVQKFISTYFDLFDKIIITTDDNALKDEHKKAEIEDKGYSFISSVYGRNTDVIRHIIRKRIELYNRSTDHKKNTFDEKILTDKIYHSLVNLADGDITLILNTSSEIISLYNWYDGKIENLEEKVINEAENQLNKRKELSKINANPPKFHL